MRAPCVGRADQALLAARSIGWLAARKGLCQQGREKQNLERY